MADLPELLATPDEITIGGRKYQVARLGAADWARITQRIKSGRADPIDVATRLASNASPEIAEKLFMRAYEDARRDQFVTIGELDQWKSSYEGAQYQFYLSLRKHQSEIDEAKAAELFEQMGREYLAEIHAKLKQRFPDATESEIAAAASQHEEGLLQSVLAALAGLPEGNPSGPPRAGQTTTTPTDRSPGPNGVLPSDNDTAGPTKRSDG
ncbi:MAG TPA: hypothetical protein VMY42_14735 [Thermoguttaceae bacterium]|nr:hypothetical protein [Thermoguttaceae bacterium]